MKIRAITLLLMACTSGIALFGAEQISGVWILEGGKTKNRFEVEIVPAHDAAGGYWLVNTEGKPLVYEGRYALTNGRLVRTEGGPKLYDGIAFRTEGTRWVWAGDRKNENLAPYVGSALRRPKPLAPDAAFNELGQGRLYLAALDKDSPEILRLLTTGTKIDSPNQDKIRRTALYAAIDMGYVDLVALLLEKGANVNYKDSKGVTPLMAAGQTSGPYPALARLLLTKGADASIKDKQGLTALARLEKANAMGFSDILVKALNAPPKAGD